MIKLIEEKQEQLNELCRKFNVKRLEIFGSAAEGVFDPQSSDIDFLIEFAPLSPVEHAHMYFDFLEVLQDMFDRDIDLVEVKSVRNPYFLEVINKSRKRIYAA
jgi:predicted nucleotidyltransferase